MVTVTGPDLSTPPAMPLALYTRMLHSRPILTQSVMTGALMAVGDVAAQQIVEKRGIADHDIMRTMRLSGYGLFFAVRAAD